MLAQPAVRLPGPARRAPTLNLVTTTTHRWVWMVAVAVAVAAVPAPAVPAPAGPAPGQQACPPGQHEDTETPGFQCVAGWCPPGMLLDQVNESCVAAPGVPPPALPTG